MSALTHGCCIPRAASREEESCYPCMAKNDFHFVALLKDCAKNKDLHKGIRLHEDVLKLGLLEKSPHVASSLIWMYVKCGFLVKAQKVIEELPSRDVVSWNALLTGYMQQGKSREALKYFEKMQGDGISPDEVTFICVLKACGNIGAIDKGKQIHDQVLSSALLKNHILLGTALVDMYAKCGMVPKAEEVHMELPVRDVILWNALISGYALLGKSQEALDCLKRMKNEAIPPDTVTYICVLKACGSTKDPSKGRQIHEIIVNQDLFSKDIILGTTLLDMYAKCGMLLAAQNVLETLHIRDIVAWNALIAGYAQQGLYLEAFNCFEQMQTEGLSPNTITFICILKACGTARVIGKCAQLIHIEIVSQGLIKREIEIGTALIDMYAKCGMFLIAEQVLKELPIRDVVSYNALIGGYAEWGKCVESLNCLECMQAEGLSPDSVTFVCILKACGRIGDIDNGIKIHEGIVGRGLMNRDTCNALISMYVYCNDFTKAQSLLEEFHIVDIVSCNLVISGHVQQGQAHEAMKCYAWLRREGFSPDAVTFTWILKAYGSTGSMEEGKNIHKEIVRSGFLEKDVLLGTALVDMYARCGAFDIAEEILEDLPMRDLVSWNTLIGGYANHGQIHEAVECYEQMLHEGLLPDVVTYVFILRVCGSTGAIDQGEKIHDDIINRGMVKKDIVIGNALVDMYVKCGVLSKAQQVLEKLPFRDVISWNTLIAGYAQKGQYDETLSCYERMQSEGLSPYAVTYTCILMACGSVGALEKGKQIHKDIMDKDLLKDVMLGNALVDMYVKCGTLEIARQVLEELPYRNIVSWSTLIAGYAQFGQGHEALNCFEQMQSEGISANTVTFICVLNACGSAGAIDKGKEIHEEIVIKGLLENDVVLGNALLDMYAKCGLLEKAQQVLEELPLRNIISWNAIVAGYAEHGKGQEALISFEKMQNEGISPNEVTFLSVLTACSRSGLSEQAESVYGDMTRKYGITPSVEHHTCMVVMFGSVGHFEKAVSVINAMPSSDQPEVWLTLLGACRKWGSVKFGKLAFDQVIKLDDGCAAAYVLMANVFAATGMHEDAEKMAVMRLQCAVSEDRD